MGNSKFTMASNKCWKTSHGEFTFLPIWIDYHFYYYQFKLCLTNLPILLNDLTHH